MIALIATLFPTLAGWINLIVGWFQGKVAAQNAATTAESQAETDNQNDGLQSVTDQQSSNAQNAALDQAANQLDNPTTVVVVQPGAKQ